MGQKFAGLFLLLSLLWLTVSTPFVIKAMELANAGQVSQPACEQDEIPDPFAGATEEKTETNPNNLSEFLHDLHFLLSHTDDLPVHLKCHEMEVYTAFHGELVHPPPEA